MIRPRPFAILSTVHGTMLMPVNDRRLLPQGGGYGVGYQLLNRGAFDLEEVATAKTLLLERRQHHGDGVVAVDLGANVGVHSVEWGALMTGWGRVIACEPQRMLYYALAGNVALNGLFNVDVRRVAVGATEGEIGVPVPDYAADGSYGSLELRKRKETEFIGQTIDYENGLETVPLITVDGLGLERCDLLKIDVEGMEEEGVSGALGTISRCKPVLIIEVIKSDRARLMNRLVDLGYQYALAGINAVAIHESDPTLKALKR